MTEQIARGDIYFADLEPTQGSEQGGQRPVLVVQNNSGNRCAPTTIVLPITSQRKPALSTHVSLANIRNLNDSSIALAEQIRTLDKSRLGHLIGTARPSQMAAADIAMRHALALPLSSSNTSSQVRVLCHVCKQSYLDAGYRLRRVGTIDDPKEKCDFCSSAMGYNFEIEEV